MGSQASVNTNDKEQQLKKASKMSLIRSLLPIVGLVVIFLIQTTHCHNEKYAHRRNHRHIYL